MFKNSKGYLKFTWVLSSILLLLFAFQNCGDFVTSNVSLKTTPYGSSKSLNSLYPDQSSSAQKTGLGMIYGPNATQDSIDLTESIGSWYYTYSPHPNRIRSNGKFTNTVKMANKYKKEFVPMIGINRFKYGEGDETCPFVKEHAEKGEALCKDSEIENSLRKIINLFDKDIRPRHLAVLGESWQAGDQLASFDNKKYRTTPWQAARILSKLEKSASKLGLSLVSPTPTAEKVVWFAAFLKRCYDMRNDKTYPCKLEKIRTFAYHDYKCTESFFQNMLLNKGIQKNILAELKDAQGKPYGGFDWTSYVNSRKIWLTETSCNWDSDFREAQDQGKYIRSQKESCLRASGQKPGYGSLKVLSDLKPDNLERFAWWTTYANPVKDTDVKNITESSVDRIDAARLVDDKARLTSMGEVIKALHEGKDMKKVRCVNSDPIKIPTSKSSSNYQVIDKTRCEYKLTGKKGYSWTVERYIQDGQDCSINNAILKKNNPNAFIRLVEENYVKDIDLDSKKLCIFGLRGAKGYKWSSYRYIPRNESCNGSEKDQVLSNNSKASLTSVRMILVDDSVASPHKTKCTYKTSIGFPYHYNISENSSCRRQAIYQGKAAKLINSNYVYDPL